MTSRNLGWLLLSLLWLGASCSSKPEGTETPPREEESAPEERVDPQTFPDVVARVNEAEITKAQLLERVERVAAQPGGAPSSTLAFYRRVLDELVGNELLYQASHDRELGPTDDEVERELATIRSRFPDPGALEQALASEGLTLPDVRSRLERDMSIQNLIQREFVSKVEVTEDAKRRFYDENPGEMRQPDRLRLSHILKRVTPDATGESREAARAQIEKLLGEARGGADFAALARQHSEDPGSAPNGGELVVARGETVPEFEQDAFALEPGGVSPVVETQFGFHIIKLTQKIPGALVPYDQVQERIGEFLRQRTLQERVQSEIQRLREGARVELFIG